MKKRLLTPLQWFEIIAIVILTGCFAFTAHDKPLWYIVMDAVAAIAGVFCVVLCVTGKRCQFYWGFANIFAYVIVSLANKYYGEVMLNAIYYLPLQFIGLREWNRHYDEQNDHVQGKRMRPVLFALSLAVSALAIWLYKLLLDRLGGQATLLDSFTTVLSVFANALMVWRYREQWFIWLLVDAVSTVLWIKAGDFLMTALWAIYTVNAVYGWISWARYGGQPQPSVDHSDLAKTERP